jgi:hypothetical protein
MFFFSEKFITGKAFREQLDRILRLVSKSEYFMKYFEAYLFKEDNIFLHTYTRKMAVTHKRFILTVTQES